MYRFSIPEGSLPSLESSLNLPARLVLFLTFNKLFLLFHKLFINIPKTFSLSSIKIFLQFANYDVRVNVAKRSSSVLGTLDRDAKKKGFRVNLCSFSSEFFLYSNSFIIVLQRNFSYFSKNIYYFR